jgi:hypothetical protein
MPSEFVIKNGFFSQGNSNVTGSFTVTSGSSVELQVSNTGVTLGNISTDVHRATGSLLVTGSMTVTGTEIVTGDLTVQGNLIAQTFIVSSSVSYFTQSFSSGSTRFGDTITDTHQFTGSVSVTGSLQIPRAATAPSPILGAIYYNTGDNNLYRSDGATWVAGAGSSGTSGQSGSSGTSGSSGAAGSSGTSGSSGSSGAAGSSGTSGSSGSSGAAGAAGAAGSSGTSGSSGSSGAAGAAGSSGTSGSSGSSGAAGAAGAAGSSGSTGSSGTSGTRGSSGTSGTSGSSGSSGAAGAAGSSGTSGSSGSSGAAGAAGSSGTSGSSGSSGAAGATGSSGTSGSSGSSGAAGAAGSSGTSGTGFNTINNASGSRLTISDGSNNAVTASANLTFAGNILTVSSSTATTNASVRNLNIINNTTGTATQSLGVGIEFESETSTTENTTVGFLDYVWTTHTNGSEWGQTEIVLKDTGTSVRSHMFAPGVIGGFNGGLIAATPQLGDFTGAYPEYRVYASGSTTDGTQTTLQFNVWNNPAGLAVPNDTTWMFTSYIVARRQDADNESAAYWLQGAIDNNAGTVALVGAVNQTAIEDTVAWNATAVALGSRLVLRVTGEAAKTIYWNAVTHIVQVSG